MTEEQITPEEPVVEEEPKPEPPHHWYVNVYIGGKAEDGSRGSFDISYEAADRFSVREAIAKALGIAKEQNVSIHDVWPIGDPTWYSRNTLRVNYHLVGSKVLLSADVQMNFRNW